MENQNLTDAIEQLRKTVRNVGFSICTLLLMAIAHGGVHHFSDAKVFSRLIENAAVSGIIVLGVMLLFWVLKMICAITASDLMPEDHHSDSEADKK